MRDNSASRPNPVRRLDTNPTWYCFEEGADKQGLRLGWVVKLVTILHSLLGQPESHSVAIQVLLALAMNLKMDMQLPVTDKKGLERERKKDRQIKKQHCQFTRIHKPALSMQHSHIFTVHGKRGV